MAIVPFSGYCMHSNKLLFEMLASVHITYMYSKHPANTFFLLFLCLQFSKFMFSTGEIELLDFS